MTTLTKAAPIRKQMIVDAPIEKAFDVFTRGMGTWWPATHSIGRSPQKEVVMEPRAGGRWYEIGEDGSECPWGDVLAWDRPHRVLLAWRIGADWTYDPALLTEVDVSFSEESPGRTRVSLEHRKLENYGERAEQVTASLDGGWGGLLQLFAGKAAG
ncbi:SRPBCC family protein [Mesorhizobium sp. LHD-90]|uniref:SRPBCC family protein n=1 Tax=Mesorhizobium sp. LHD-90 TaxID=3071414 RepID=UPI0027DEDB09|nr:SRPBCC family protein [Mesorhizobium sp. LHD-90]MDQ6438018.1 SRPBCC family protein [Mesorhizobium sp. LHD-90]